MSISTEEIHDFNTFQATLLASLSANNDVARYAHPTQSVSITSHLFTSSNPCVNFALKNNLNSNTLHNIFNVTLHNEWNLYWFQVEQYLTSEIEMEDLRT